MLLDEVANYIQSHNLGIVGTNIFKSIMPSIPVNCIALYEDFGQQSLYNHDLEISHEIPELQVVVRHTTAIAARARCEAIMRALALVKNMYLDGTFYLTIDPLSTPFFTEPDENKNSIVNCRFKVVKVTSTIPVYTF